MILPRTKVSIGFTEPGDDNFDNGGKVVLWRFQTFQRSIIQLLREWRLICSCVIARSLEAKNITFEVIGGSILSDTTDFTTMVNL